MTWLSFTIVGVFSFAIFYTLSRVFLKEKGSDPISYAILFNLFCAGLIALVSLNEGFVLPDIRVYGFNLALTAILYTTSQILIFKASKIIEASELIIFFSSRTIWAILTAMLFLGETFTIYKIIGTVLILVSVCYVSLQKNKIRLTRGHVYTLVAAVCIGVGFVNDSYILKEAHVFSYGALAFILPAILTMLIFPTSAKKMGKYIKASFVLKVVLLSIFYSIGVVTSYMAYQAGGDASQIVPIGQSVVVVTVIFATFFLGERNNIIKKIVASIIVSIGVLLLK